PTGIVRGLDGKMWFTETDGARVGSIDPTTGPIVEFDVPGRKGKPDPIDENTKSIFAVVDLATGRTFVLRVNPRSFEFVAGSRSIDVTAGPDGAAWILHAD